MYTHMSLPINRNAYLRLLQRPRGRQHTVGLDVAPLEARHAVQRVPVLAESLVVQLHSELGLLVFYIRRFRL